MQTVRTADNKRYKLGWFETVENQMKMHTNDFYDEGDAHIGLWENNSGEQLILH
ncbi:MAG: hypothetical protein LBC71_05415 [Oscillospiraceae bacterium]|jgi:hypothetical protein|nr:hypothetical protein [Oscillospiraceae bacterium]